jgi:hypothetical protein
LTFPWFEGAFDSPISSSSLKADNLVATFPFNGSLLLKDGAELEIEGVFNCDVKSKDDDKVWTFLGTERVKSHSTTPIVNSNASSGIEADWFCTSCTMQNNGSAKKCSTCDAPSPAKVYHDREGKNPAPFKCILASNYRFMYGETCRSDRTQHWIAVKERRVNNFLMLPDAHDPSQNEVLYVNRSTKRNAIAFNSK